MSNNFNRHVKSDSIKWALTFIAILLIMATLGLLLASVITQKSIQDMFDFSSETTEKSSSSYGDIIVSDTLENGISLSIYDSFLNTSDLDNELNNSNSFTLVASINPSNASNKLVEWSASFQNAESEWAEGKNVSEYISVEPSSEGALTANVKCLKSFAERIEVTVTSLANSEISATCVLDYARRIKDWRLHGDNDFVFDFGEDALFLDFDGSDIESVKNKSNEIYYTNLFCYYVPLDSSVFDENFIASFSDFTIKDCELDVENNDYSFAVELNNGIIRIIQNFFSKHFGLISTPANIRADLPNVISNNVYYFMSSSLSNRLNSEQLSELYSLVSNYFVDNPDEPLFTIDLTFNGNYSDFSKTWKVYYNQNTLNVPVWGITVSNESYVF